MRRLFTEIRRRRVLGTTALYLAGSWVVLEVSSLVLPLIGLNDNLVRVVFFILIAGFPVAVILSWFFDINVRGEASQTAADSKTRRSTDGSERPAPQGSIAVLPFSNVGSNPEFDYFSDGLAEELLHVLASVPEIKVAARTSCFMFKDKDIDIRTIGSRLGVRNVLEGSVRWAGNRIRVTAQLVEVKTGYHLMSETFDEQIEDIFALQGQLADAIVNVLRDKLGQSHEGRAPVATPSPTANFEAYQCYLRGRHRWQRRGEEAIRDAIALYEQALAKDPAFARAKSSLAAAHAVLHEYTGESRLHGFELAQVLAQEALELDPQLPEPHAVLGYINLRLWRWAESEERLMQALALDPNDPLFHQWYANLLNDLGRQPEALAESLKAYELDRVSPMANNVLAVSYMLQGRDGDALRHVQVAREFGVGGLVPVYVTYLANLRAARWDEACVGWQKALEETGRSDDWVKAVVKGIAHVEHRAEARTALQLAQREKTIAPNLLFLQYVLLEDGDAAFALADTLLADNSLIHAWLMLPEAAALRSHERFQPLMATMGVAQYWEARGKPVFPRQHLGNAKSDQAKLA